MTSRLRRWVCAAGTRHDRLRDPDAVVAVLGVRPAMVVADLGPGAGHFTLRLARAVEPDGVVYALDTSRSTLDELSALAKKREITTLRAVPVPRERLEVPSPVDLLFVSATYHHLPQPSGYFAAARRRLRPGGRVAILESRREGILARWLAPHATEPRRVQREMKDAGYRLVATHDVVRGYWVRRFRSQLTFWRVRRGSRRSGIPKRVDARSNASISETAQSPSPGSGKI